MPILRGVLSTGWLGAETVLRRIGGVVGAVPGVSSPEAGPARASAARLLSQQRIPRITVVLHDVIRYPFADATVTLDLEDVEFDRVSMLRGDGRLSKVGRGTITMVLTAGRLSGMLGTILSRSPMNPDVEVKDGALVLRAPGFPSIRLPIPHDLLPGKPSVTVSDGRLVVTTTFEGIPEGLLAAAQRAARP